jgi:DNA-binding GntR family transcriptional regulator
MSNGKGNLEDFAYRSLIEMIVKNKLRPGDAIFETEMAELFGISRTPLRQALGRLVTEGILEKRKGTGCFIPVPNPQDAQQVFDARQRFEIEAVELACLNTSDEDLRELKQILKVESKAHASYDKEKYWWANQNFHFGIFKAARNVYIERCCRHIFWRSSIYIFFFDSFYSENKKEFPPRQLSLSQHPKILKAIVDGDPKTAAKAMKEHIQTSFDVFLTSS